MKRHRLSARPRLWVFLVATVWFVVCVVGCNRKEQVSAAPGESILTNNEAMNAQSNNSTPINQVIIAPASNAPRIQPDISPVVSPSGHGNFPTTLPDFTTYLVNLSSASSINTDAIGALSKLCAQLKQQTSIPEMNAIMECRVRSDTPLSANESPKNSIVSFYLHNSDLQGEKLSIEGWNSLKPAPGDIGVIDFKSPQNKFERFRVVTFPAGTVNQPIKLPPSLLQANQSGLLASFEQSFASRIARLAAHQGFLQLRPFLRTEGGAKDLIDALPPPYKSLTANGNELHFTRLRSLISNAQNEKERKLSEIQRPLRRFSDAVDSRYLPPRMQKEIADAQQAQALLTASIGVDRACLAMIPANLLDPRLDHVALFFIAGNQIKMPDRIELIRFETPVPVLEGSK